MWHCSFELFIFPNLERNMNLFPPSVEARVTSVQIGDTVAFSNMFTASDLDGDDITLFRFRDDSAAATSGFFTVRGVRQASNTFIEVGANDLQFVRYNAGLVESSETFTVQVGDGGDELSNIDIAVVNTIAGNFFPPTIDVTPGSIQEREILDPQTLFNVSDPEGNPPVRFFFADRRINNNGGFFLFNGQRQESGRFFVVEADELDQLSYVGGRFAQTENIAIQVFDGEFRSEVVDVAVTTLANQFRPEVNAFNVNTRLGATISGESLVTFSDEDGNTPRVFGFLDTGLEANSGFFTVNGVRQEAGTFFQVQGSQLSTVEYQVSEFASSEVYRVFASDGRFSSEIESATVSAIPRPSLVVEDFNFGGIDIGGRTVILNSLEEVNFSSVVSQTGGGSPLSSFQVVDTDLNNDVNSARLVLDGNVLERGTVHDLTALEFSRLEIRGGFQDDRSSNQFLVRGRNELFFTDWEEFRIETVPNLNGALTSGNQFSPLLDNGERTQITFSFIDGVDPFDPNNTTPPVPSYYAPDADIRDGAFPLNDAQRAAVRAGLDSIETIADIEFVEVPYTIDAADVQITFGLTNGGPADALGFTTMPIDGFGLGNEQADVWFSRTFFPETGPDADFGIGSQFFVTAIHEVGHTIGFTHPFAGPIAVPISLDTTQYSVMAGPDAFVNIPGFGAVPIGNNGFGLYDIFEAQRIYRPNEEFNADNNQYRFDDVPVNVLSTIYDAGGRDTFNLTSSISNEVIDLHQGAFSTTNGLFTTDGLPFGAAIAYGTIIENARGGSGNDTITGNSSRNLLFGNEGNDVLEGDGGIDTLRGGAGRDTYIWRTGDGRDLIDEQTQAGVDSIHIFDGTALNSLEDDLVFRRFGRDLRIDLRFDQGPAQGSITIRDQQFGGSRVETLRLFNANGTQIGQDIDLNSIFVQADTTASFFRLSDQQTNRGFIAVPV